MFLSVFRSILCIASLLASWALVILSMSVVAVWTIDIGYEWLGPIWNDGVQSLATLVPWFSNISDDIQLSYFPGNPINSIHDMTVMSLQVGIIILAIFYGYYCFRPIKWDIKDATIGLKVRRLESYPGATSKFSVVTDMLETLKINSLYVLVVNSRDINAFAIGKPLSGAIVLTEGILELPTEMALWVFAHEIAHIYYGDSFPQMLWMASNKTVYIFKKGRAMLLSFCLPILSRLPLVRLFIYPIEMLLIGLHYSTIWAERCAKWIFKIMDMAMRRAVEYKADRMACKLVGAKPGIEIMNILGNNKSYAWLKDHPSTYSRAVKMRKILLASSTA